MNKIKTQLESILKKLKEKENERNNIAYNRSEKWQGSEECYIYQEKTEIIIDIKVSILEAIEQIDEYLQYYHC